MSASVAIPIEFAALRVFLEKGRHWSVVEHVILHAISVKARSAAELAEEANLPTRLVMEALINLMRAGWAEIRVTADKLAFAATPSGTNNAAKETLPPVVRPLARSTKFAVEQIAGSVLRWRELTFLPHASKRLQAPSLIILQPLDKVPSHRLSDIADAVLEDDESYIGADQNSARFGRGYALVTVSGGKVKGLPRDIPTALKDHILEACERQAGTGRIRSEQDSLNVEPVVTKVYKPISFVAGDLVLGGEEHKSLRNDIIRKANAIIVIHSTFVSDSSFDELLPYIAAAVRGRGVRVELLWGKTEDGNHNDRTRKAVHRAQTIIGNEGLEGFVKIHPFSTNSHAKMIVADDGQGGFRATVGSCNWLSTNFDLFEVSISTGDSAMVADVLDALSQMAFEATGRSSGIALDLAGYACNVRKMPDKGGRGKARLILGPEHADLLIDARDKAQHRIVIGSHRFGNSAETLSLIPTRAAVATRNIQAAIYVGTSAKVGGSKTLAGKDIAQTVDPQMHAKFLAWDDDDVLVTSHNLLSADPGSPWAEVGIHVNASGVANKLIEALKARFAEPKYHNQKG